MDAPQAGIRKAAILLASLEGATAEVLLARLTPLQAHRVRRMLIELDTIDLKEQRRVIDEFFRVGSLVPEKQPPGIELDDRLARRLAPPAVVPDAAASSSPSAADARPFRFLRDAEADKLARVLCGERPQTIALVLSHLPAEQAGRVLVRLSSALQVAVIHRLVDLEETDPTILREVERVLESRLSEQVRMQRRRVAGVQALAGILEVCGPRIGTQILDNLAAHDRPLADRLRPPAIDFDDLMELSDAALGLVFQAADPEVVFTALIGALPEWSERILARLSPHEAEAMRQRLDHPGPLRLSDVEEARQQIAELARRLAMEGRLTFPRREKVVSG